MSLDRLQAVRDIVVAHLPGFEIGSAALLGEGRENHAYESTVRLAPLPVPEPIVTVPEDGCLAYIKLPGVPLLNVADSHRSAHSAPIGATLEPEDQPLSGLSQPHWSSRTITWVSNTCWSIPRRIP